MLWLFLVVNFADKAIFGLAAVPIMRDLGLTHAQLGILGSSFYVLFSVAALGLGWLGDRCSTKWLIAAIALVWTVAQLPIALPIGFGLFLACRILLGAGEGPSLSISLHEAYKWFPDQRRPLVTGVIESGLPCGAALAALIGTWVIVNAGWRFAFALLGIASLAWCIAWLFINQTLNGREVRATGDADSRVIPVPPGENFWSRTLVGAMLAAFATYCVSSLTVIWLPPFFQMAVGLSPSRTGDALSIAWLIQIPLFPLVGWISQALHRRWRSTDVSRSALMTAGVGLSGAAMIGLAEVSQAWLAVLLAIVCLSGTVVAVTTIPPILGEVALAGRRSLTLGACVGLASVGGIIAPLAFGVIVDAAGHGASGYRLAFLGLGALIMAIATAASLLTHPSKDRERLQRLAARSASI